jgi:Mg2+-importing ATPase
VSLASSSTVPGATSPEPTGHPDDLGALDISTAAGLELPAVLARLSTQVTGLSPEDVVRRRAAEGSNALRSHGASAWRVLWRQLNNPLLGLLAGAVVVSGVVGDKTDAALISAIVASSVILGFVNEYRSARAVAALQDRVTHTVTCVRDGHERPVDVVDLVPGDIVDLRVGDIVPADVRLVETVGLEVDESVLTGESLTVAKQSGAAPAGQGAFDLPSCAFMGTVVAHGTARAVVVTTGMRTVFGKIAAGLGEQQPVTAFQLGLRQFSALLVKVAAVLTVLILVINIALGRPLLEALLFSLAIAIGISPQLLPAIVTISLSQGAKRLATRQVLVKRLVSIEDLGNLAVLFTDKTGTLTQGAVAFERAVDPAGQPSEDLLRWGLICNEATVEDGHAVGGNQLDVALWEAAAALEADNPAVTTADITAYTRIGSVPFDHERRLASVVVDTPDQGRVVVVKGAPEAVLARCEDPDPAANATLGALFAAGARVIAVGSRSVEPDAVADLALEQDLALLGFLVFADPPKLDAPAALDRLARLGIIVKVITGDNVEVATKVSRDVGLTVDGALDGPALDALDDEALTAALPNTTVFARVSPDQKARIIRLQRAASVDVGFLGDGVNDAVALHAADVGISVDTATDVAKSAADIVLLDKDLNVLADGVAEGRRTFANIMKYVLMATSSNFGNMFSAATASLILTFLPMLPSQLLLNNLLYDIGQLTLPNDRVDEELLTRPSQWDVGFIRRYMTFFGPISSLFDFATFAVLLLVLHTSAPEFRTGWFVESLATQSLVILVIRTRRVPFFRSRPARPLAIASVAVALVGAVLPFTPLAGPLGFSPLPLVFYAVLLALVATYLTLAEFGKRRFFRQPAGDRPLAARRPSHHHHIHRRAARFSQAGPVTAHPRSRFREHAGLAVEAPAGR